MDNAKTWGEAITISLIDIGQKVIHFFPKILGAFLIITIGWFISVMMGKLIARIINKLGLDLAAEKVGFNKKLPNSGIAIKPSGFIGELFKWFFVLVFLTAATSILELDQVNVFFDGIVAYIPNVFVAVIILTFVFLFGNFIYHIIKSSTRAAGVTSATLLANIAKWSIIIFGIFAALIQLGIAPSLVNSMFIGVVAMISLAGGLAFGLGGKEEAQLILRKLREELTEKYK
ncbi:MAG: hypothetical protein WAV31_03775 [Candidatus Moraniibacteriota bacterium]